MTRLPHAALPIGNVCYGTCGWTDPSLLASGRFYPRDVRTPAARLRHYARHFPLVEVDSTYYAPPSARNARLWVERTPPGFRFDVKAYGLLTRHPVATGSLPPEVRALLSKSARAKERVYLSAVPPAGRERLWALHDEALRPLAEAGRLGCVLFQFPRWFRRSQASRRTLHELAERLPGPLAVEFRGGGWMEEDARGDTLALLERLGLAYVVVDEPQGFRSSTPPVVACTAPLALIRFHGRNAETWEASGLTAAERFRYLYSEAELREWLEPARRLAAQAQQVHVLMNNCYGDYAVRNALDFARLLGEASATGTGPPADPSARASSGPCHDDPRA